MSRELVRTLDRPEGLFVGTPAALAAMTRGDRRVMLSRPQAGPDGRQVVHVRLARRGELVLPGERARHMAVGLVAVAAGSVVGVALAVVLALAAVTTLMAHLQLIAGSAAVALLALYLLGAVATRCPGLHCVGCTHR